jgi:hypothetical protein
VRMLLIFMLGLLLSGCAAKRIAGVNYIVPASCLTAPVELVGCNQENPPRCHHSVTKYRKGCEQIELSKEKK